MAVSGYEPEAQPTLAEMDIIEVEPGVIEDTFENRQKLRSVGYTWIQHVPDDGVDVSGPGDGVPLIQTMNTREQRQYSLDKLARKTEIMSDPEDAWSDFVDPRELLADSPAPYWVKTGAACYARSEAAGRDPAADGFWLARRCKVIKRDGTRCWNWAGASAMQAENQMCRPHLNVSGGGKDDTYVKSARMKLMEAAPAAADMLENLAMTADIESVRLKASIEILDRVGIRGGTEISNEVTVTHVHAAEAVKERLDKLREARDLRILRFEEERAQAAALEANPRDVVDAEIIE